METILFVKVEKLKYRKIVAETVIKVRLKCPFRKNELEFY